MKFELNRQYEAHLPMCRRANMQGDTAQSISLSPSQTVFSGTLPQYAVYTSGQQQQFLSPLLLLSSVGTGTLPSAAVQFMTVAASDASCSDGLDSNLTQIKQESDNATSVTRLLNGDAVLDKKHEELNGVCKSNCFTVDTQAEYSSAPVVDGENSMSSVPASPVTKPTYNTRQRRSISSLRRSSEPSLRAVRSSTVRHMSADQPLTKKAALESDSLPLFLTSMTDDD